MSTTREKIAPGLTLITKRRSKDGHPRYYWRTSDGNEVAAKLRSGERIIDRAVAIMEARRILGEKEAGRNPFAQSPTLTAWVTDYLAAMAPPTNAESTLRTKRETLGWFTAWLTARGVARLTDVTRDHIDAWHNERKHRIKPVSMRREAAYIKHALAWAVDKGHLASSPAAKLKTKRPPERIVNVMQEAETLAIAHALAEHQPATAAAWLFLAETGCRPGEMFGLMPEAVDLKACTARFVQAKTGKVKTVYFSEESAARIRALMRRKRPAVPRNVFIAPDGKAWDRHSFRWHVYRWGAEPAGVGVELRGKRVYALGNAPRPYLNRHTKATKLLVDMGGDWATVSDLMGTTPEILKVYVHSNEQRKSELARASLAGTKKGTKANSPSKGTRS